MIIGFLGRVDVKIMVRLHPHTFHATAFHKLVPYNTQSAKPLCSDGFAAHCSARTVQQKTEQRWGSNPRPHVAYREDLPAQAPLATRPPGHLSTLQPAGYL